MNAVAVADARLRDYLAARQEAAGFRRPPAPEVTQAPPSPPPAPVPPPAPAPRPQVAPTPARRPVGRPPIPPEVLERRRAEVEAYREKAEREPVFLARTCTTCLAEHRSDVVDVSRPSWCSRCRQRQKTDPYVTTARERPNSGRVPRGRFIPAPGNRRDD